MEQHQTQIPLHSAMWCYDSLPSELKAHPFIGNTIKQCLQATLQTSLTTTDSPLTPILGNPKFPPGIGPGPFQTLRDSNCVRAPQFVKHDRWPSIVELMDPTGPFTLTFWNAVQIHHFLQTIANPQSYTRPLTSFEEICSDTEPITQILSRMYTLLNTPMQPPSLSCITKWETDLHCTFTAVQKQNMIVLSLKSSICTKIQETNFKILTRWYLTPSRLHMMFTDSSDQCWRCQREVGTMLHMFWSCPRLTNFWSAVRSISQKFTDFQIPNDPAFFLLHVSSIPLKSYKKSILRHLTNAAKSCIPMLWKQQSPPTTSMWLRKVEDINKMEDLIMTAQNRQTVYQKTWTLWNMFKYSEEGKTLFENPN